MHSRSGCIFLIVLLFGVMPSYAAVPVGKTPIPAFTDIEAKYFVLRDKLCLSKEVRRGEVKPLEVLKEPTLNIVGTVKIEGFAGKGGLAIEPGYDGENPCDHLDGLQFSHGGEGLTVTTASFLANYLARHPQGGHSGAPTSMEELYALSDTGAKPDNYADIPVRAVKGQDVVSAYLYGGASDIGPYLPDHISVEVWVGQRRFTLNAQANAQAPEIPECSKIWQEFAAKADKANEIYQEATGNGRQIPDKAVERKMRRASERIREDGLAAFQACYRKVAREKALYAPFVEQAQSMADRLKGE